MAVDPHPEQKGDRYTDDSARAGTKGKAEFPPGICAAELYALEQGASAEKTAGTQKNYKPSAAENIVSSQLAFTRKTAEPA